MSLEAPRNIRGITLVEVMMVVAILGIISVGVATLLTNVERSYAVEDARNGIKTATQTAINKIGLNITACKRLFQNTANDNAFLALATGGFVAGTPAVMAGSVLPVINAAAALSPNDPSYVASATGNSLFLASVDFPFDQQNICDSTPGCPPAGIHELRIDIYHFNYYYLSQTNVVGPGNKQQIMLEEWHSVKYADYGQIVAWGSFDATLQSNLVKALVAAGYPRAWDSTQSLTTQAFYTLNPSGTITGPIGAPPNIGQTSASPMFKIITGTLGYGYRNGVAPNTSASFSMPFAVPQFCLNTGGNPCTQTATYPSGFEIQVVGSSSARQILTHLALAAQGAFKGTVGNQQTIVSIARDLH